MPALITLAVCVGEELRADTIQTWLVTQLASKLGVSSEVIDSRERLSRYGIDSRDIKSLLAELGVLLKRQLSPTLAWTYPTIEALAKHLAGDADSSSGGRTRALEGRHDEPIAIIGMACRFPKAPDVESFWSLLRDGVDAITEAPPERWSLNQGTRWGGFLEQVDRFDPLFFGISPREAIQMDPQQRLALELSWEALESAGVAPGSLMDSRTGVFMGAMWGDYAKLARGDTGYIGPHTATGQDSSIITARVSYSLGLRGPSLTVNTACSSALVAVHLACQSLRNGESSLALAGGVNLLLAPDSTVAMTQLGALSPDGRCKAFDARANGYVRGEGGGIVVLKPLSRALADGDSILCVIRGSAVNNDGFSNGLTAPNPRAQEDMLREAYARAGVSPDKVHYVETHGTGTSLGDPIEANALSAVLGEGRPAERPLIIGSVKTNIGHLEAASGIAGLVKSVLAIQHRAIPPNLHFEQPNPYIRFEELRLLVPTSLRPWPYESEPALAGISSFGFGGTNAHLVLEAPGPSPAHVAPVAADDPTELTRLARELRDAASAAAPRVGLSDLCFSVAARENRGAHRLALIARSQAELVTQLDGFLSGEPRLGVLQGEVAPGGSPRPVFVFSGTGSQWPGMGRELLRTEPVFRAAIERCDRALRPLSGWSLLEELAAGEASARLKECSGLQTAIFAVQVGLAELWRSWGIEPACVVGHSIGEVAAAHVAGILDLEDAARVIHHLSRQMGRLSGRGAMLSVDLPADEAERLLGERAGHVVVAAHNAPASTVLSGAREVIEELGTELERRGITAHSVRIDTPSHSPHMDPFMGELAEALEGLSPRAGAIPMSSTVTAAFVKEEACTAGYWVRNLREPVRFSQAILRLLEGEHRLFLELAPHPILARSVEQCLRSKGQQGVVLASMRRGESEGACLRESLGRLFTLGAAVHWRKLYPAEVKRVELPIGRNASDFGIEARGAFQLLPLSAHTQEALESAARALQSSIAERPDVRLEDLSYSTSVGRSAQAHRLAFVVDSKQALVEHLEAFLKGESRPGRVAGICSPGERKKVVFVLPGQGSQWPGMGRELLRHEPVFREALEECDEAIRACAGWSLIDELLADEPRSRMRSIEVIQPTLFAIEVAMAALWRSWGVEPDAVVGHSMGEAAAACIAGVLRLKDAARVICDRSQLLRRVAGQGGMAVVELSLAQARELLSRKDGRVSIGASNSPRSTVLSGDAVALEELLRELEREGIFCRRVKVDVASHSPQMDPLKEDLLHALSSIVPRAAAIPLYSTVTGEPIEGALLDASYWMRNLREPVLFSNAIERLAGDGHGVFVELSPHPILLPSIDQTLRHGGHKGLVLASLRREEPERAVLLESLGTLFTMGGQVDFRGLHPHGGRRVRLPTPPWQRQRFWLDMDAPAAKSSSRSAARPPSQGAGHPLLGHRLPALAHSPACHVWENSLERTLVSYLDDHRVGGTVVLPGTSYIEMALASAAEVFGKGPLSLRDVELREKMSLSAPGARTVQLSLVQEEAGHGSFQLHGRSSQEEPWTLHGGGAVHVEEQSGAQGADPLLWAEVESVRLQGKELPAAETYEALHAQGNEYGPLFRGIEQLWIRDTELVARLRIPEPLEQELSDYRFHPAALDLGLQALVVLAAERGEVGTALPTRLECIRTHAAPGVQMWCYARLHPTREAGSFSGDVLFLDESGQRLAELQGARFQLLGTQPGRRDGERVADWLHEVEWQPASGSAATDELSSRGRWVLFSDGTGLGDVLATWLVARGGACIRVSPGEAFAEVGDGRFVVNPEQPDDVRRLFEVLARASESPLRGIVHLWSLDALSPEEGGLEALGRARRLGPGSVLSLIQGLDAAELAQKPRLWLVTRGVQSVGEAGPGAGAVAQAPIWGLGQVVAYEHSELRCTRVDLAPVPELGEEQALLQELLASDGEDQVALRGGDRHVPRLTRCRAEATAEDGSTAIHSEVIRSDGSYLITGGLGGLGLTIAKWLVEQGARHLVLVGRSGASAAAEPVLASLRSAGAEVLVMKANVANASEVEEVVGTLRRTMPPLRGIVHAAGLLDDGTVLQLTQARLRSVMAPKVEGAWNLHQATLDAPLDFFVLFSSSASLVGMPGQGNYAAANAFLDALAGFRKARGLTCQSIQWGPWSEVGLAAARENRGGRLSLRGMGSLSPREGLEALATLLSPAGPLRERTQLGVLRLDARRWCESYPAIRSSSLFAALLAGERASNPNPEQGNLRSRLHEEPVRTRRATLESFLREEAAQVLRLPPSRIELSRSLQTLGMDSLLSLELRNRLEAKLALTLPATLLWNYPTLNALTPFLAERMGIELDSAEAPLQQTASSNLSEEDGAAMLKMLEQLKGLSNEDLLGMLKEDKDEEVSS
ncbi:SDR family NAD(P)-dependent oxidoreductase [Archangium violaceum]|nr:SDR family NAD(P)-dependent oxidoreductase [Archangium violaceum]